jgi:beta-lactamase regulating signal transducer with metallopeptidase domain
MTFPYALRLLCLCFSSFFVLNAVFALAVGLFSKFAVRFAESVAPRAAARFLLLIRLLPFALAALFVLFFCVPSYLWLEPANAIERVSSACVVLGLLGACVWSFSLARALRAVGNSIRHNRFCARLGLAAHLPGTSSPTLIIEREAPLLAMSGLLRPRVLISRGVLRALSAEELDAALSHEHAHCTFRDNAKRLLLLLAPDVFPFVHPLRILERHWAKFTEWAADDHASAGDPQRAATLAAALVSVARLGARPTLPYLSTSLLACDRDLFARVDRLLHPVSKISTRPQRTGAFLSAPLLFATTCLVALLLSPLTLSSVHALLEYLVR